MVYKQIPPVVRVGGICPDRSSHSRATRSVGGFFVVAVVAADVSEPRSYALAEKSYLDAVAFAYLVAALVDLVLVVDPAASVDFLQPPHLTDRPEH